MLSLEEGKKVSVTAGAGGFLEVIPEPKHASTAPGLAVSVQSVEYGGTTTTRTKAMASSRLLVLGAATLAPMVSLVILESLRSWMNLA